MVAQITNHDITYVRRKMKYADALMYRTIYCDLNQIPYASRIAKPKPMMQ